MDTSFVSNHRLIIGTTGSGKSALAREIIRRSAGTHQLVAFDHDGQLSDKLGIIPCEDARALAAALTLRRPAIYVPRRFAGDKAAGFAWWVRCVWSTATAREGELLPWPKLVYCDEVQKFARAGSQPPAQFLALGEEGRRYRIDLLLVSLSANRLHHSVRDMMQVVYAFRTKTKTSGTALEDFGFSPDEVAAQPKFHYTKLDPSGDETHGVTERGW